MGIAMTAENISEKKYLTQKELAKRWCLSQSCVKNYRDAGLLPYFRLPQSSRVLYPLAEIEQVEAAHTYPKGKEVPQQSEIKKEKPGISSTHKKWRI